MGGEQEINPSLAANGSVIAYQLLHGSRSELWQRSLSDGSERLLLQDAGSRTTPHWSRDGSQLAYTKFVAPQGGTQASRAVMVLPLASGTGERVVAHVEHSQFNVTDWSPDARSLIGTCGTPRRSVCELPLTGSRATEAGIQILASDLSRSLYVPRLSPDQRWIGFHAVDEENSPGVSRLYIAAVRGGTWQAVTDGRSWEDKERWAPDGKTIYFVSNRTGFWNVWGRHFDPARGEPSGPAFPVTSFETPARMLEPSIGEMEIGISANRLIVPLTEATQHIWSLDGVDR
jgi:Tol biopolymer transport system component